MLLEALFGAAFPRFTVEKSMRTPPNGVILAQLSFPVIPRLHYFNVEAESVRKELWKESPSIL